MLIVDSREIKRTNMEAGTVFMVGMGTLFGIYAGVVTWDAFTARRDARATEGAGETCGKAKKEEK